MLVLFGRTARVTVKQTASVIGVQVRSQAGTGSTWGQHALGNLAVAPVSVCQPSTMRKEKRGCIGLALACMYREHGSNPIDRGCATCCATCQKQVVVLVLPLHGLLWCNGSLA